MDKLTKQLYIDKKTFVCIFRENWERYKKLCKYRKVKDENVQRLLGRGDPKICAVFLQYSSRMIDFSFLDLALKYRS